MKECYQCQGAECLLISNRAALWLQKESKKPNLHSLWFIIVAYTPSLLEAFLFLMTLQHFLWMSLPITKSRLLTYQISPWWEWKDFSCCGWRRRTCNGLTCPDSSLCLVTCLKHLFWDASHLSQSVLNFLLELFCLYTRSTKYLTFIWKNLRQNGWYSLLTLCIVELCLITFLI